MCCPFPTRLLDEIWDLIESVSGGGSYLFLLMHTEYILSLILEKCSCLQRAFSHFYEEKYVKIFGL